MPSYREKPPKLVGGCLCLDFVNTVSWRGDSRDRGERLTSYAELLLWAKHAGVLDARSRDRLAADAKRHPRAAKAVVDSALELREALAGLFLGGRPRLAANLAVVNERLTASMPRAEIRASRAGFAWSDGALDVPLRPVLWSAAELLTSGRVSAVRSCSDARCRWLFLDTSPSGRRRWCSMRECGNRAKVRRHHQARKRKRVGAREG